MFRRIGFIDAQGDRIQKFENTAAELKTRHRG